MRDGACVCGLRQVKRNSADISSLKNDVFNLQSFVLQDNDAAGEQTAYPQLAPTPAHTRAHTRTPARAHTPHWPGPVRAFLNANLKGATPVQMWQGWVKSRCRCGERPLQPIAQHSA
jgi:hypothetical protein